MMEKEMARWSRWGRRRAAATSFDVALDDPDDQPRRTVYVDVVALSRRTTVRRSSLPQWRGAENIKKTLRWHAELAGYRVGYHAARLPFQYVPKGFFWGTWGALRLQGRRRPPVVVRRWRVHLAADRRVQRRPRGPQRMAQGCVCGERAAEVPVRRARRADARHDGSRPLRDQCRAAVVAGGGATLALPTLAHFSRPPDEPNLARRRHAAAEARQLRRGAPGLLRRWPGETGKRRPEGRMGSAMSRDARNTGLRSSSTWRTAGRSPRSSTPRRVGVRFGRERESGVPHQAKDSERRHTLFVADRDPLAAPPGRPHARLQAAQHLAASAVREGRA